MLLVLTVQQRAVLEALRTKDTDVYPLSRWYHGALATLANHHNPDRVSQAAHSLRELLEKLPRVVHGRDVIGTRHDFAGQRRGISERLCRDEERYAGAWKNNTIDGQLDKTLRKVGRYFELNQQPTRREQMGRAVANIDPMGHQFSLDIREAKRDRLHELWKSLEGFAHHKSAPDIREFEAYVTALEIAILDLLAPITAQDQQEIQSILKRSLRSQNDEERLLSLIERRGANFVFFFKHADAAWVSILKNKGYFDRPPNGEPIGDGEVNFPFWWPIHYLTRVTDHAPDEVTNLVLQLPKVDNPRIYDEILDIALRLQGNHSAELKPKILEYAGFEYRPLAYGRYAELLAHWTAENQISAALDLFEVLVKFEADPQSDEKQKRRYENPDDWTTSLEPAPRFDQWEYQEILEKGVRPLAETEPYKVARVLIESTASMMRLKMHQDDLESGNEEGLSEFWCRRLNRLDSDYPDSEEALVHTLTFACEMVFERSPESIAVLDETLRNQRWKIFKRLRQHLYGLHPNEQTKPWIRDLILGHDDYAKWEHHYEFQRMIRCACEHFGAALLTEEERTQIFDAIRIGPSKERFREWLGESFTEEKFDKRRRYFHRKQFMPFASVLFGDHSIYFRELEVECDDQISDEDYSPVGEIKSGWGSTRSPRSPEDLGDLTDEELLFYINNWQDERHDEANWLVEINIEALAEAFQTVFTESVIPDAGRLRFWMENREHIERLIYVRAMINGMEEETKAKDFSRLSKWLEFCEWVLSHPDQGSGDGPWRRDQSRDDPNWHDSRRAVGDLVGACLEQDVDVPTTFQGQLAKLLDMLCTQFDWRLDQDQPVLLNRNDPLTEAINNTRSRALEDLIKFGLWLRRNDSEADVYSVITILEKRFDLNAEHRLTTPEYAILGRNYVNVLSLVTAWATEHKSNFFPQDALREWLVAFGNLLVFTRPNKPTFEILREDFDFALQHIGDFEGQELLGGEPSYILGQHLFAYYLWGVYPLQGEESLLERFYERTNDDRKRWAELFNHIGRGLHNSGRHLDSALKDRATEFFEWRLEAGEPTELQEFTFWMKAECLEAEWRLDAYSRVLDVSHADNRWIRIQVQALRQMLPENTAKVVECFAKLTDRLRNDTAYIRTEDAKAILEAGLESGEESVRNNAERARENLLRMGRFDLMD